MIDWTSPQAQHQSAISFGKYIHALTGLFIWELFITSGLEWRILTGKKRLRFPMLFYFGNRYTAAASLICGKAINCQVGYTFLLLTMHISLGLTNITFAIRTVAIWSQSLYIIVSLSSLILGQWGLIIFQTTKVSITKRPGGGCIPMTTYQNWILAIFLYSLFVDSVVIVLTTWKLRVMIGVHTATYTHIIFRQGVGYFLIAFCFNLLAIVFMILDLNFAVEGAFNTTALVTISIAAGRAVRSLSASLSQKNGGMPAVDLLPLDTVELSATLKARGADSQALDHIFMQMERIARSDPLSSSSCCENLPCTNRDATAT
ncbi:hypothetical protein CPB83DRAFT_823171 [Crepidotus variabilis]|uniref:Uncharacterized protein n=1 Tax=Crepidotus variabilis TaxID=179855 RepID=A0A9P6E464_9AGAR|nr:hypothetical protein CPB83DRAFT_823171 [Crepidotus variabilis]